MRDDGNIIKKLQEDVVIPANVQAKADAALASILQTASENKMDQTVSPKTRRKLPRKKMILLVAAAILLLGTATVGAAAYIRWSRSLEESLHATEEIKQLVKEEKMSSFPEQSVTDGGVTVTARQCICDGRCAYISFKVEGYDLKETGCPDFENMEYEVEGFAGSMQSDFSNYDKEVFASSYFYDGTVSDEYGNPVNGDGSAIDWDSYEEDYIQEDGSLEYQVLLYVPFGTETLIGKKVHITLTNLGALYSKMDDALTIEAEGIWEFEWTLEGTSDVRTAKLDATLGDTGARVISCEISPISGKVEYEFPRRYKNDVEVKENGEAGILLKPPYLEGIRMKDGTCYYYATNGIGEGWGTEESKVFIYQFDFDRIIDINQVDSLLFIKNYPKDDELPTEDNYYVVPLEP